MKNEENKNEKLVGIKRYKFTFVDFIDKDEIGSIYTLIFLIQIYQLRILKRNLKK